MKYAAILLLVLSGLFSFGRTEEDTAHAVKGALRLRDSMRDPAGFQVSRVVITDKGVCFEYRSRNESGGMSLGFAVYNTDKDLAWIDNSWIWQRACLSGKYAQRRDGKDVTEAVSTALKGRTTSATKGQQQAPPAQTVVPAAFVARAPAQPVAPIAPLERTPAARSVAPAAAVGMPAPTVQVPVAAIAPAVVAAAPAAQPTRAPVATQASAPLTESHTGMPVPVAPVDTGAVRGVTIIDGALSREAIPAGPESLGDAARRLKNAKQQKTGAVTR